MNIYNSRGHLKNTNQLKYWAGLPNISNSFKDKYINKINLLIYLCFNICIKNNLSHIMLSIKVIPAIIKEVKKYKNK